MSEDQIPNTPPLEQFTSEVLPSYDAYMSDMSTIWKARCAAYMVGHFAEHVWSDIPQMTSNFVEIVPVSHRQGNYIPFAAIRWLEFGNRPAIGRPFGRFSRHSDTYGSPWARLSEAREALAWQATAWSDRPWGAFGYHRTRAWASNRAGIMRSSRSPTNATLPLKARGRLI